MVCSPSSDEPVYCEDKLDRIIEDAIKGTLLDNWLACG